VELVADPRSGTVELFADRRTLPGVVTGCTVAFRVSASNVQLSTTAGVLEVRKLDVPTLILAGSRSLWGRSKCLQWIWTRLDHVDSLHR